MGGLNLNSILGGAKNLGIDVLGNAANIASIIGGIDRGNLQQVLLQRAQAMQDPASRAAMEGSRFLSRSMGVGGTTLPVVPGKTAFRPNLPPLDPEQQSALMEQIAKATAYQGFMQRADPMEQQRLIGTRGMPPAALPPNTELQTREGYLFGVGPQGEGYPIAGVRPSPMSFEQMQQLLGGVGMGGEYPGGGGYPGEMPEGQPQVSRTTGVSFDTYGHPRISASTTTKPPKTASLPSPPQVLDAAAELQEFLDERTAAAYNPMGWGTKGWESLDQQRYTILTKQIGMRDPVSGKLGVDPASVTTNGQLDRAKHDAIEVNSRKSAYDAAFDLVE